MGLDSFAYYLVFVLHIVSVVIGIGTVSFAGLYGAKAQADQGPGGYAISRANFEVNEVAEKVIYTIPVWGILLVILSDGVWGFGQTWVWLSIVLYIAAVGIATGILTPTHRRMNVLLAEMTSGPPPVGGPPPQAAELETLGKKMARFGPITDILAVVLIVLMIWKPGS